MQTAAQVFFVTVDLRFYLFAFIVCPDDIGVNRFSDRYFFAHGGIFAAGDLFQKFIAFCSSGLRAFSFGVATDGFPVSFAFGVRVPEAVDAIEFAGVGISFGGDPIDTPRILF